MQDLLAQLLLMLRGAWRYRWPALALTWVVALGGWLAVASMPDRFEARTRVYVDTQSLLKPLLEGIAVNRDVDEPGRDDAGRHAEPSEPREGRARDRPAPPRGLARGPGERHRLAAGAHRARDDRPRSRAARRSPVSNQFTVTFEDSNPKTAHRVVQSLLDTFMEDSLGLKRSDAGVAERFLRQQLGDYERKLLRGRVAAGGLQEDQRRTHARHARGITTSGSIRPWHSSTTLRTQQRQLSERRNELQRQLQGEEPTFGLSAPVGSAPIDSQIASYQARIDQMLLQYTDKHPEIVALRDTIARLEEEKSQGAKVSDDRRSADLRQHRRATC